MDHRVEPPAWLPQGAAPEAADAEADDSTATEDTQQVEDSQETPAEAEFTNGNGNGHDSSFSYSRDDSYHYGGDSFGDGTSYRSPFTPHRSADSTSYHSEEQVAENGLAGGGVADVDEPTEPAPPGHELPASGLSPATPAGDALPGGALPGSDPASGPDDPATPDTGLASAAPGLQAPEGSYTDHGAGPGYTDHGYTDTAAASYSDPAALPYPPAEPLATAGTPASEPTTTTAFSGPVTPASEQRSAFRSGAAVAGGIGAALRAGKQRTSRFSRGQEPDRSRPSGIQPRKANLVISRVEPWSVMKFSFLISLVLWVVLFVAVALLYYALSSLGVFDALQRTLASVTSSQSSAGVNLAKWTSATRVLGYTILLGAVDVVLITAISTVGAVVYNLVTYLGGGIEVTLKETE